ncbi:MAG: hypothetical protein AB1679_19170 [Actinomycetota bacterium]
MTTSNGTDRTRPDRSTDLAGWFAAHDGLLVVPLHNPVLDTLGHHPTSPYAEQYWVPTIGPTASILHRRLAAGLDRHPDGYPVHLPTLAREIGLGAGTGRGAPLTKSLVRLVGFNLAEITDGRFAVRPTLPPLTRRQAAHLPPHLAQRHHRDALVRPTSTSAGHGLSVDR